MQWRVMRKISQNKEQHHLYLIRLPALASFACQFQSNTVNKNMGFWDSWCPSNTLPEHLRRSCCKDLNKSLLQVGVYQLQSTTQQNKSQLRTMPTFVNVHKFCASLLPRVSVSNETSSTGPGKREKNHLHLIFIDTILYSY